jgi:hypothetical protein
MAIAGTAARTKAQPTSGLHIAPAFALRGARVTARESALPCPREQR